MTLSPGPVSRATICSPEIPFQGPKTTEKLGWEGLRMPLGVLACVPGSLKAVSSHMDTKDTLCRLKTSVRRARGPHVRSTVARFSSVDALLFDFRGAIQINTVGSF